MRRKDLAHSCGFQIENEIGSDLLDPRLRNEQPPQTPRASVASPPLTTTVDSSPLRETSTQTQGDEEL